MISQEQIEIFFIEMLENRTCPYTSYYNMPDSDSFTYCIKEIVYSLKNSISNNLSNNYYKHLISNFYKFMQKDIIFCKADPLQYRNLMIKLKIFSEGDKTSKNELFSYFENLDNLYTYLYKTKMFEMIVNDYNKPKEEWKYYYKLFNTFINELLANGINYKYLNFILIKYKNKCFSNLSEFWSYLYHANMDSFDILLPLKNVISENIEYLGNNGQQIECFNDKYYCKVYGNKCIDFFYLIKQNITRIEAMFNILRLYSKSTIDFDIDDQIIVNSKYFKSEDKINFDSVIRYKGLTPYYKHLGKTLTSLEILKDKDKDLYHKVLNIISYAEKDKDICNQSSYVDNWISLESLCSLCGRKNGYDAVEYILPKVLAPKIIANNITDILKKAYRGKNRLLLEGFIDKSINQSLEYFKIDDIYYQFCIYNYSNSLRDIKKLKILFEDVEYRLKIDILRIYMLRNEYVHESNLQAFNSMQQIKLKNLLSIMLDEFFKALNRSIARDFPQFGLNYEIFTQMLNRNEARLTSFEVLLNKPKAGEIQLATSLEEQGISLNDYILNVLKNNLSLFKKYI